MRSILARNDSEARPTTMKGGQLISGFEHLTVSTEDRGVTLMLRRMVVML